METQAKHQYDRIRRELLQGGEREELAEKLEALRLFLESADFHQLRSESEKILLTGKKVRFILHFEAGNLKYEMKEDKDDFRKW